MTKEEKELKPHWDRLVRKLKEYGNGKVVIEFQDGLPVKIREIEGKDRDIDLTQNS